MLIIIISIPQSDIRIMRYTIFRFIVGQRGNEVVIDEALFVKLLLSRVLQDEELSSARYLQSRSHKAYQKYVREL